MRGSSGARVRLGAGIAVAAVLGAGLAVAPGRAESLPPSPDSAASAEPGVAAGPQAPAAAGEPAPRGDVVLARGVRVWKVKATRSGRLVRARVRWNQAMIAREGHLDRFNVRLVAFGAGGAANPVVLASRSTRKRPPAVQHVRIKLGRAGAKQLRASPDAVLAVSQQYGLRGTHSNKYFRQYVTVTAVKAGRVARSGGDFGAGPLARAGRDCRAIEITPGADLSGCDLSGADLSNADLSNVDLTGADLSGTDLRNCNLAGARLAGADLTGVVSGGITGTPASLPAGWELDGGSLLRVQTVTFGPAPTVVVAGNGTVSASSNGDGAITYASTTPGQCTVVAGTGVVSGVSAGAGNCAIRADAAGTANWAAGSGTQTFSIGAAPCTVGAPGPGGGIIFYNGTATGLCFEAAPEGWNGGADPGAAWGCEGTEISGAGGTGIGTGQANTAAIVAACVTGGIAARLADGYVSSTGKSDWFLPSQGELNELYLQRDTVGGFAAANYWSSSGNGPGSAWFQFFDDGGQFVGDKRNIFRVRPVRAF